jgi:putative toxin-antitoxin system antitoxin component (TIGR02293 family)
MAALNSRISRISRKPGTSQVPVRVAGRVPAPRTAAEVMAAYDVPAALFTGYATAVEALPPGERIAAMRGGLPSRALGALAEALQMPRDKLAQYLGIPRSTLAAKIMQDEALDRPQTERVVGVLRLVAQTQRMLEESASPQDAVGFDVQAWLSQWLQTPVPALGGSPPAEYLDTAEGVSIVSGLLAQMQSGAYA